MIKIILLIIFIVVLVVFGPFATIWSLNTLFNLSIAYTLSTWAAVLVFVGAISIHKS